MVIKRARIPLVAAFQPRTETRVLTRILVRVRYVRCTNVSRHPLHSITHTVHAIAYEKTTQRRAYAYAAYAFAARCIRPQCNRPNKGALTRAQSG